MIKRNFIIGNKMKEAASFPKLTKYFDKQFQELFELVARNQIAQVPNLSDQQTPDNTRHCFFSSGEKMTFNR